MIRNVIVVGAGMAGLAAAQALHRPGLKVEVLERNKRVGGRVHSQAFHGRIIERGAQFPSTGYRHMPSLLAQAGLQAVRCSPWAAFERGGRWHRVHQNRPLTVWSGGLLGVAEAAKLAWGVGAALRQSGHIDPANYASFSALDDEDAGAWSNRVLGAAATSALFEPSVHGFYFHPLAGSSRALLQALLGFRNAQALAVPGGWAALPLAMAQGLVVRTGVEVSAVREIPGGVQVVANGECLHADAAVLAAPAPVGIALLEAQTPHERALLETRYAAAIHVALGFRSGWHLPSELHGVHGLLMGARSPVAAMVVEQARLPCAAPEVLTLMLGDASARRLMDTGDDEVLAEVLAWLRPRWPELHLGLVTHDVHRWPLAEPLSPPGRARAVANYRSAMTPTRRIILCGDYTGLPWTDGAVDSGLWAAERIKESLAEP